MRNDLYRERYFFVQLYFFLSGLCREKILPQRPQRIYTKDHKVDLSELTFILKKPHQRSSFAPLHEPWRNPLLWLHPASG